MKLPGLLATAVAALALLSVSAGSQAAPASFAAEPMPSALVQKVGLFSETYRYDIGRYGSLPSVMTVSVGDTISFERDPAYAVSTTITPSNAWALNLTYAKHSAYDHYFAQYRANAAGTYVFYVYRNGYTQTITVYVRY